MNAARTPPTSAATARLTGKPTGIGRCNPRTYFAPDTCDGGGIVTMADA